MARGETPTLIDVDSRRCYLENKTNEYLFPLCTRSTVQHEILPQSCWDLTYSASPIAVSKLVDDLCRQVCKYHFLALSLGSCADGENLREELFKIRKKASGLIICSRNHLMDSIKNSEILSQKEMTELERTCRLLVGCIHMLDRELRRSRYLFHLFPLVPDADGMYESQFIKTGISEENNDVFKAIDMALCEKYCYEEERESWQQLEDEILELHNLDLNLHRDSVLGPLMDYLALCPNKKDIEDISTLSIGEPWQPPDNSGEEAEVRPKSNILCYTIAIFMILFIGSGVLMGVIFVIVK